MVLQDNVSYINNTRIMLWGTTYGFTVTYINNTRQCFTYINNTRIMLWGTTYGFTGQCFLYQQYTYYVMRDDLWFYRTMFPISTIHVLCYEGRLMVLQDNVSYINNTRIMLWGTTYGFTGQCFLYQQYTYYVMRDDLWFYRTMFPISTIHVLCYEGRLMVLQDNVSYINNTRIMLWGTTYGFTGQCFLYQQYTYYVMRDDLWFYRTMFPISTIHVLCYEGRLMVLQDNVSYINNTRIMLWGRLMVLQDNVPYINNTRIMLWGTTCGFPRQCYLYQQYTYYVMRDTYCFRGQCSLYQQYTYYVMRDDLWF